MATTVEPEVQSAPDEHWYTLAPEQVAGGLKVDAALGLSQADVHPGASARRGDRSVPW